jgi:hypothetical protein
MQVAHQHDEDLLGDVFGRFTGTGHHACKSIDDVVIALEDRAERLPVAGGGPAHQIGIGDLNRVCTAAHSVVIGRTRRFVSKDLRGRDP